MTRTGRNIWSVWALSQATVLVSSFPQSHKSVSSFTNLQQLRSITTTVSPRKQQQQYFDRFSTCPPIASFQLHSTTNNNNNNNKDINGDSETNGETKKQPQQKKKRLNPSGFLRWLLSTPSSLRRRFASLSKRAKAVLAIQMMVLGIFMTIFGRRLGMEGIGGRRMGFLPNRRPQIEKVAKRPVEVPYSVFMDFVEQSGKGHTPGTNPALQLSQVTIGRDRIGFRIEQDTEKHAAALSNQKLVQQNDVAVKTILPRQAYAMKVNARPELVQFLRSNQIPFRAASTKGSSLLRTITQTSIFVIYMIFLMRMYRTMNGGGSSDIPGKLAKLKKRRLLGGKKQTDDDTTVNGERPVTFDDIEGIDGAKFEVMELVDALRNPGKYAVLGARAPTGLLLEGPPGTGKTMLAKACANTVGVPLLYCSGSDFVEMFVGRGAARVRKTFERAGKIAPCIIFIDELDALGKSRSGKFDGGFMRNNDEAEQTLNQLLACMDGLDSTRGICVLAATNRRDVLDQALVRPGRFDRLVKVTLPDVKGRERILRVHAQKLPGFEEGSGLDEKRPGSLGKGTKIDLSAIATVTAGLSGAELEFIVNEAAIRAVRRVSGALREGVDRSKIDPKVNAQDFEESVRNYFETRKVGYGGGVGDVLSSVLRPRVT